MKKIEGILAVTATPFKNTGEIDYATVEKHLDHLLASGVHGVLPVGATGEFAALSTAERKQLAEFVCKQVHGRVPVVVGAVSQNVDTVIEVAEHAASIGASGIMVLSSPGLHLSQDEIYAYYAHISSKVSIPVMVYNNPGSAGVDIEPRTMARIAALPRMDYLKESTGSIQRINMMVNDLSGRIVTLCGCEDLAYESFIIGAQGWVCVLANIAPAMAVEIWNCVRKGDLAKANAVYQKVLPILRLFEASGQLWQIVKYVMQKQGFGSGTLRRPRMPISSDVKEAVDFLLEKTEFQ